MNKISTHYFYTTAYISHFHSLLIQGKGKGKLMKKRLIKLTFISNKVLADDHNDYGLLVGKENLGNDKLYTG